MKICVYAISKNEQQFVQRFCSSASLADLILVCDTGSTDGTPKLLKEYGAQVYNIAVKPWRFDTARDTALNLIPGDYDVCVSLDLDEVLEPGWREEIERVWTENTTRLRYKFDWGHNILFYYEKIHHRHGYHWHHPVHEYPRADGRIKEVYAHTDKLLVSHHPDPTKSRSQYLDLLRLAVSEDPHCSRNAFYFARELTFYNLWQEAIGALNNYLELPGSTWPNERCYAMRLLGKCYENLGDIVTAQRWHRLACIEAPNTREPWVDLALNCYSQQQWLECYYASKQAVSIVDKQLVYTCDPEVWTGKPHDLLALSSYNLGYFAEAIHHGKLAAELSPHDTRMRDNLTHYLLKE